MQHTFIQHIQTLVNQNFFTEEDYIIPLIEFLKTHFLNTGSNYVRTRFCFFDIYNATLPLQNGTRYSAS